MVQHVDEHDAIERLVGKGKLSPVEGGHGDGRLGPQENVHPLDADVWALPHDKRGDRAITGADVEDLRVGGKLLSQSRREHTYSSPEYELVMQRVEDRLGYRQLGTLCTGIFAVTTAPARRPEACYLPIEK